MKRRSLFWKTYPYFLVIVVVALALSAFYGSREMRALYTDELVSSLESQIRISARTIEGILQAGDEAQLAIECRELSKLSGSRITIITTAGLVLGDSHEDPAKMDNHGSRPEIVSALSGAVGNSTRFSSTLQTSMMYVAVPLTRGDSVLVVIRASVQLSVVEETLGSFYRNIAVGGLVIIILTALISVILMRKITVPLRELRNGVILFAEGNLETKLRIPEVDEIADLSEAMNRMATMLDNRIRTIAEQSNEREAILASMSEGVMALGRDQKIVSLNKVAADLLGLDRTEARDRLFYEVVRIPALLEFVEQAARSLAISEAEISLSGSSPRHLQLRAARLRDNIGGHLGTVLVFNDITRLKKLERIRQDFVANVSHELKTPITAIIGSAETLLDEEGISQQDSRRFLEMIARQSERLNSLIEDLLSLARLESESEKDELSLTRGRLLDLLESSVAACAEKAKRKRIRIDQGCEPGLEIEMNQAQLEQAIINLIDNAIKYSDSESAIQVEAKRVGDEIMISVADSGIGISSEHLKRLFERFYRVDQARSREAGGTGLGLAIVKHIALAHKGRVEVASRVGQGSRFSIYLPARS